MRTRCAPCAPGFAAIRRGLYRKEARDDVWILELLCLTLPAVALLVCALLGVQAAGLLTTAVAVCALLPFFLGLERKRPRARDILPIVILCALCVAGRLLFSALPNFKPISAIVILAGLCFGKHSGYLTGALAALTSNLFFGQGLWTPWQMLGYGAMGYIAGANAHRKIMAHPVAVCAFGALASFLFGVLLDSWYAIAFVQPLAWQSLLAAYVAGLPFNAAHAASAVVFLAALCLPWRKKLLRIREKYGIGEKNCD